MIDCSLNTGFVQDFMANSGCYFFAARITFQNVMVEIAIRGLRGNIQKREITTTKKSWNPPPDLRRSMYWKPIRTTTSRSLRTRLKKVICFFKFLRKKGLSTEEVSLWQKQRLKDVIQISRSIICRKYNINF